MMYTFQEFFSGMDWEMLEGQRKHLVSVKKKTNSIWSSGCLTITGERKALTFARNLRKNHMRFIKQCNWNGMWCGQPIRDDQMKLKVKFETIVKTKNGNKK